MNPGTVAIEKEMNLAKLRSVQFASGAFPWIPGGEEDLYITLYILAGFSEALRYGVDVPRDMIDRALGYVNSELPRRMKEDERNLAFMVYAAYVVTSFPKDEFTQGKAAFKNARDWVDFAAKYLPALTPFGKAYMAYCYWRFGEKDKANAMLDMAMDGAREDPIAGVYWTPEKYSWVWYSDTVEKHAFLLRTLQELRPKDKKIPGMVQWLLFNRKGTVWKSTRASAAAVYALLDFLSKSGALTQSDSYAVSWGEMKESFVVKPDDFLAEPLRWMETSPQPPAAKLTALIDKDGPGLAFASMTWIYSTDQMPEASSPGMLTLDRTFYRRVKEGDEYHLKPLKSGDTVFVGDEVRVALKVNTRAQFEYMHLADPKAAGFEGEELLSGWKYDKLSYYQEPRDSLTNFFVSWLPHGEYILSYTLRPSKAGTLRVGAATLQSMYAPEMTAHSAGFVLKVEGK